jgi:flavin reductase (DIM6/NTAB) family NADH-FMN oxidoreductase RutF
MEYAPENLKPRERYKLLAGFVLPRPIAWVTTVGPTGVVNAAPYSFFNVFCEDPPLCMFAVNPAPRRPRQGYADQYPADG